ncbi:MAG: B12-binding domain-containing radical SAM protein [Candidatus Sumerlaeia bacterium]|nr:B12-binding domain-containing radical SAM protein [Candidatus Sumerlaeia bacterium]
MRETPLRRRPSPRSKDRTAELRVSRREQASFWRKILATEQGTPRIIPPADCEVALVYPNHYSVGMSSLGYQMVYRWINEHPRALAERFFCEGGRALSVEHQRPLDAFELIAFSFSYELDYLEAVRFLMENRIAPKAAERHPTADPIVLAGGISLLVNRLPIYDLADVLVLGDGEDVTPHLLNAWCESGGDRRRFLEAIARLEGVEVTEGAALRFNLGLSSAIRTPRLQTASLHLARPLNRPDAFSAVLAPLSELGDRCLVEIARGCPYRCTFCFIGETLDYRPRPLDCVFEMLERGRTLANRFGLIAPAVGSHPDIERICEYCLREGLEISFSSLRLEDVTPAMLELLAASGQQLVTLAPEAGSERLRRLLGKRLSNEHVTAFAAEAAARGIQDFRLYFMLGLPTEEMEDIEAIARLVGDVHAAASGARTGPTRPVRISVSASVFVPKPGTPLAKMGCPSPADTQKHIRRLTALLGRMPAVCFRPPSLIEARAQRVLSWAGRDALDALIAAAHAGGSWRAFLSRQEHSPKHRPA